MGAERAGKTDGGGTVERGRCAAGGLTGSIPRSMVASARRGLGRGRRRLSRRRGYPDRRCGPLALAVAPVRDPGDGRWTAGRRALRTFPAFSGRPIAPSRLRIADGAVDTDGVAASTG